MVIKKNLKFVWQESFWAVKNHSNRILGHICHQRVGKSKAYVLIPEDLKSYTIDYLNDVISFIKELPEKLNGQEKKKYIKFIPIKKGWLIKNNKGQVIGSIEKYRVNSMRQWTFDSDNMCWFTVSCLQEISNFISNIKE